MGIIFITWQARSYFPSPSPKDKLLKSPARCVHCRSRLSAKPPQCAQDSTPDRNPKMSTRCRIAWVGSSSVLNRGNNKQTKTTPAVTRPEIKTSTRLMGPFTRRRTATSCCWIFFHQKSAQKQTTKTFSAQWAKVENLLHFFFGVIEELLAQGLAISVTKNQTKGSSIKQLPCKRERNIQHTTVIPQIHKTIANGSFKWNQKTGADFWTKIADRKPNNIFLSFHDL